MRRSAEVMEWSPTRAVPAGRRGREGAGRAPRADPRAILRKVGARLLILEHLLPSARVDVHQVALLLGRAIVVSRGMEIAEQLLGLEAAGACAIGRLEHLRILARAASAAAEMLRVVPRRRISPATAHELDVLITELLSVGCGRDAEAVDS